MKHFILLPKMTLFGRGSLLISAVAVASVATSNSRASEIESCRDQNLAPFAAGSIWNMPIGDAAVYSPANIFPKDNSSSWPKDFFSDDDYFIVTQESDPEVPWYNQGWWGNPTGSAHCNITGKLVGNIRFPANATVTAFGNNNGAAILQPDNDTLVLTQPLYVCEPGAPVLSLLDPWHGNTSIRGNGTWGGHGGSSLSALGGTIRKGELLPGSAGGPGPRHALKLELFAHMYYYNSTDAGGRDACYHWPALNCDGYALNCNASNGGDPFGCYGGTNPLLTPGSLLAVPPSQYEALNASMATEPGRMILWTLTNYGGYLVDDTYWYRGTLCTEHGVTDEFQAYYNYPFNASPGGSSAAWYNDLLSIFQALSIVTNNGPNSIGGGGQPLQPLAPPFCNYTRV